MSSVIESVRAFINTCPYLDEWDALVGVTYLPEDTKTYAVEASITDNPVVKRYLDGSAVKRFNFQRVFWSRQCRKYGCRRVLRTFFGMVGRMRQKRTFTGSSGRKESKTHRSTNKWLCV